MGKLLDRLEKLLIGYTSAERADIMRRYMDWRVEQVIVGSLERLIAEDEATDEATDEAAEDTAEQSPSVEQGAWRELRSGSPVAEEDLPPAVRAFAQRVAAVYGDADAAELAPAPTDTQQEVR